MISAMNPILRRAARRAHRREPHGTQDRCANLHALPNSSVAQERGLVR
jgi:hypothetical protein